MIFIFCEKMYFLKTRMPNSECKRLLNIRLKTFPTTDYFKTYSLPAKMELLR